MWSEELIGCTCFETNLPDGTVILIGQRLSCVSCDWAGVEWGKNLLAQWDSIQSLRGEMISGNKIV